MVHKEGPKWAIYSCLRSRLKSSDKDFPFVCGSSEGEITAGVEYWRQGLFCGKHRHQKMSLRSQALNVEDLDAFSDLYFPFYTCMICDFKNTPSRVHNYKCQKILSEFNSCYFLLQ